MIRSNNYLIFKKNIIFARNINFYILPMNKQVYIIATLLFCLIFFNSISTHAGSGNLADTVYYDGYKAKVKKKYAQYFRTPAIKEGDRYIATLCRKDGRPIFTGTYKATMTNYHLSIDDGTGFKDGRFVVFNENGDTASITIYAMDKPVEEHIYRADGTLMLQSNYDYDSHLKYETLFDQDGRKVKEGAYNIRGGYSKYGMWIYYFEGTEEPYKIINYENGTLNGSYAYFDPNTHRKATAGQYLKGKRNGKWIDYDTETGAVLGVRNYRDGYLQGDVTAYDIKTGKVLMSGKYDGGYKTGNWNVYFRGTDKSVASITYSIYNSKAVFYDSATLQAVKEVNFLAESENYDPPKDSTSTLYFVEQYLADYVGYPKETKDAVNGKIGTSLFTDESGRLAGFSVIEEIDFIYEQEVLLVMSRIFNAIYGQAGNMLVKVHQTLPVVLWK